MQKQDITDYKKLSKPIKALATIYCSACVMLRINAKNKNQIAEKLQQLDGSNNDHKKLFNKDSGFWYLKFAGQPFSPATIDELEKLLPGVTLTLIHPLWRALDICPSESAKFNFLLNSLSPECTKHLYKKDNVGQVIRKLFQGEHAYRIAKNFSMEALACLILIAKECLYDKSAAHLQRVLIAIRNLIFTLSSDEAFRAVSTDIYILVYHSLFIHEKLLLEPLHKPEWAEEFASFKDGSIYPYYYRPTYFISDSREVLNYYQDKFNRTIDGWHSEGLIKKSEKVAHLYHYIYRELNY